jgi:hypothetical protein
MIRIRKKNLGPNVISVCVVLAWIIWAYPKCAFIIGENDKQQAERAASQKFDDDTDKEFKILRHYASLERIQNRSAAQTEDLRKIYDQISIQYHDLLVGANGLQFPVGNVVSGLVKDYVTLDEAPNKSAKQIDEMTNLYCHIVFFDPDLTNGFDDHNKPLGLKAQGNHK